MKRILLFISALAIAMPNVCRAQRMESLPNPLKWEKKAGEVKTISEWNERREEISRLIQEHEIGIIPEVKREQIKARMDNDTLFVTVTVGKESLTLSSHIEYPKTGTAPYPLLIGSSRISLPDTLTHSRPMALMNYHERQVNGYSQFRGDTCRTNYGFVRLYPELIDNGAYSMWAWGFQRIIDGLEILLTGVFAVHALEDGVRATLYAEVQVIADVLVRSHCLDDLVCEVVRVGGREADAHVWGGFGDDGQQIGEINGAILSLEIITIDILAEEGYFLEAFLLQVPELVEDAVNGTGTLAATGVRDDTVRTEIVAATHDRHIARNTVAADSCRDDVAVGLSCSKLHVDSLLPSLHT